MLLEGPPRAAAGGRERAADALPPRARVAGRQGGPRGLGRLLRRTRLEGTGQLHAVLHILLGPKFIFVRGLVTFRAPAGKLLSYRKQKILNNSINIEH